MGDYLTALPIGILTPTTNIAAKAFLPPGNVLAGKTTQIPLPSPYRGQRWSISKIYIPSLFQVFHSPGAPPELLPPAAPEPWEWNLTVELVDFGLTIFAQQFSNLVLQPIKEQVEQSVPLLISADLTSPMVADGPINLRARFSATPEQRFPAASLAVGSSVQCLLNLGLAGLNTNGPGLSFYYEQEPV